MAFALQIMGVEGRILNPETCGLDEIVDQYITGLMRDEKGRWGVVTTDDIRQAMAFSDSIAALNYWKQEQGPPRPDGKPNRPLTTFTVQIVKIPEEGVS